MRRHSKDGRSGGPVQLSQVIIFIVERVQNTLS